MNNVIIACDFSSFNELNSFLKKLGKEKPFLKIGYQLFYKIGREGIRKLKAKGFKIFLDLKIHDIPNTVYHGVESLKDLKVDMLTVHAAGGIEMMKQAKLAAGKNIKVLAVTQLTSTDSKILKNELLINNDINSTILHYAKNANKAKVDGVICSPNEVKLIKSKIGKNFLTVTPGIRYSSNTANDQKRIATPQLAKKYGSDYIVVGRPITKSDNPKKMYKKILKEFN
ncbi:MAG: orotidine-5'-phosphate decarboxylase [Mycoplasmoidaceae bacterium]|nr:orotidine-5'-phosphate decarboxylase [Mycoplasmoidaceae bacterium]